MRIYCSGLPYAWRDSELKKLFEKFGSVTFAHVKVDEQTGRSMGYGFIEMGDIHEGHDAIVELNGVIIENKCKLKVNEAVPSHRGHDFIIKRSLPG